MSEEKHVPVKTVAELIEEDEHESARHIVQGVVGVLIAIGLLFTGALNFMLYGRAFEDVGKIVALIPALLIEGSLAVFMLGSFVWFAAGTQGRWARIFGWAMFAVVAMNTIVEFNILVGNFDGTSGFIHLYATWGVPLVIPLVIGFWKMVIDADPNIKIMRQRRKIQQQIMIGRMEATMKALGDQDSRTALEEHGKREADDINRNVLGYKKNGSKPAVTMADESPVELPTKPAKKA